MSVFRQTRFTRNKDNSKMQTTSIFENEIKYDIPTIDSRPTMSTLSRRHKLDRHPLQSIISENEKSFTKYAGPADADGHDIRKDPSYTNFKVPFVHQ
ncbi:uncharacterized protein LOC108602415 isoform X2 [Drosophila busckii]|uniref:uncharacterized protein LOC108602415 isoform X2 n=1 Tax=Drosophila busckii TaxID=30019 RepID=UPI00083F37DF|nr:uncharacterized protein LOC108602415 isoform X2 [Drosophila busckii]